jgi:hypothetical protein
MKGFPAITPVKRGGATMGILNNEQVQTALIALIVVALNALAQWVRSKVSHTKIVDDYWCYVQPVAEAVRVEAVKALAESQADTPTLKAILTRGLAKWADSFRLNERKEPTATQIAAVETELAQVIEAVLNGGK